MMTEPCHFATVKAEGLIRVGRLTGPAEIVGEEIRQGDLEVLDHDPGLTIQMGM